MTWLRVYLEVVRVQFWCGRRCTCRYPQGTYHSETCPAKGSHRFSCGLHIRDGHARRDYDKGRWSDRDRLDWRENRGRVEYRHDSGRSVEVPRSRLVVSLQRLCRGRVGSVSASCRSRRRDRGRGCGGYRHMCGVAPGSTRTPYHTAPIRAVACQSLSSSCVCRVPSVSRCYSPSTTHWCALYSYYSSLPSFLSTRQPGGATSPSLISVMHYTF